jgi:hypothetical protein
MNFTLFIKRLCCVTGSSSLHCSGSRSAQRRKKMNEAQSACFSMALDQLRKLRKDRSKITNHKLNVQEERGVAYFKEL